MPGMTSVSGKGSRDIEPANCIYETDTDCDKVRVRESAHGWAATVMSPAAGKLQVLGPKGPLLTNRMTYVAMVLMWCRGSKCSDSLVF